MEENNEITDEETEFTEEKEGETVSSDGGFGRLAGYGLAMLAGGLACKFIIEPATARFKDWRKKHRKKDPEDDDSFVEDDLDETKKDSEEA